jgi:diacylglycerol kinase family enzyme
VVGEDRLLAELASSDEAPSVIGLIGGDLHRTLGSPARSAEDLRRDGGTLLVVDLGTARLTRADGSEQVVPFAAHVVVRTGAGPRFVHHTLVAMNAAFLGADNLGPRAHPDDGLLDLVEGRLGWWDVLRSGSRRRSGTHVPHPGLTQQRCRAVTRDFPGEGRVSVDGVPRGGAVRVELGVSADAATILI